MSTVQIFAPMSVIIPCYCCAKSIVRAVQSVVFQTLLPKELFLIDDASPDGDTTVDVLHGLKKKYGHLVDIKIILLNKNNGPGVARNFGWDASSEPYIAFLDADDSWHPEKLKLQFQWMKAHPEIVLSGHICSVCNGEKVIDALPEHWDVRLIEKTGLMLRNPFSTPSVMIKRDVPLRFEEGQSFAEDYYLWQQVICTGHKVARIELPLAYLYKAPYGASGLSSHLWKMEKAEIYNYWKLYRQRHLSFLFASFLTVYSSLKFCRRAALVMVNRKS